MKALKDELQEQLNAAGVTLEQLASGHDARGRFTKGNKGGGRPKMPAEFHAAMKGNALAAMQTIISIMDNEENRPETRLKAAMFILDHSYGTAMKLEQKADYNDEWRI